MQLHFIIRHQLENIYYSYTICFGPSRPKTQDGQGYSLVLINSHGKWRYHK